MERFPDKKFDILYVDDEEHNLNSFKAAFRRYYNIHIATSAREGLQILKDNAIHLVITDQRMPGMTGVQFLEACIPEYPEIIRMILTGFSDIDDIIQAINTGRVYRYITKPWDENELKLTMDLALDSYELKMKNSKLMDDVRQSEMKFRSIIQNTTDIISILDTDSTFRYVSPSSKTAIGYFPYEMEGKPVYDFIDPLDKPLVKRFFEKGFSNPGSNHVFEFRYLLKENSNLFFEAKTSFMQHDPNIQGIIMASRDITERKRAEELVREREISRASAKMKEQFLANISHEIRTPMNAVIGLTRLALQTKVDETQYKYLQAIRESSENLLVIINDILDFSKIEAGKMEIECIEFNLVKVLEGVENTLRHKAEEKSLAFKVNIDPTMPVNLFGDPYRLNQILLNLTGNAIKFTEKGTVTISCKSLETKNGDVTVEFSVIDTGIGIEEKNLESIFESFSQASSDISRKYGGTGLGLSITKQLVELQSGKIYVKSKPGEGAVFSFIIQYKKGSEMEKLEVPKKVDSDKVNQIKHIRILLAEDNKFNQIVAVSTLQSIIEGVKVDVANDGKEVLQKLSENNYDIILMDLQMPEMNGYEATKHIRSAGNGASSIPIIALTANATQTEVDKCMKSGMEDYISKPFDEVELFMKIYHLVTAKGREKIVYNSSAAAAETKDAHTEPLKVINLEYLEKLSRGNKQYMKDMINLFLDQTSSSIDLMKSSLEDSDYETVSAISHRIRPSFAFMGLPEIENDAKEIEKVSAERGNIVFLKEKIQKIEKICNVAYRELAEELKKL